MHPNSLYSVLVQIELLARSATTSLSVGASWYYLFPDVRKPFSKVQRFFDRYMEKIFGRGVSIFYVFG